MTQTRRSLSVSGELYDKLVIHCKSTDDSMSNVAERELRNFLGMKPRIKIVPRSKAAAAKPQPPTVKKTTKTVVQSRPLAPQVEPEVCIDLPFEPEPTLTSILVEEDVKKLLAIRSRQENKVVIASKPVAVDEEDDEPEEEFVFRPKKKPSWQGKHVPGMPEFKAPARELREKVDALFGDVDLSNEPKPKPKVEKVTSRVVIPLRPKAVDKEDRLEKIKEVNAAVRGGGVFTF